jgi:hypothetical protein
MLFGKNLYRVRKRERYTWFAWYPVRIIGGQWAWLEWVGRRLVGDELQGWEWEHVSRTREQGE